MHVCVSSQCAQIGYRCSHMCRSTSCPCEVSRERRRRALPLFLPRRFCTSDPRTWELAAPTIDPTSSWLLPRSTTIGWLNGEDTMSSRHLWWGPPAHTFWDHCFARENGSSHFSLFSTLPLCNACVFKFTKYVV